MSQGEPLGCDGLFFPFYLLSNFIYIKLGFAFFRSTLVNPVKLTSL